MTDRELLELAAKAAGIEIVRWDNVGNPVRESEDHGCQVAWNPLASWGDGDALRLAVKLEIDIDFDEFNPNVEAYQKRIWGATFCATEPHGEDAEAATRRAIVRAAAEIGKGMK